MRINLSLLHAVVGATLGFARRHFGFVFFVLFLGVCAAAGLVFFQYGYRAVITEQIVSVRAAHVKQNELDDIIRFMNEKAAARAAISAKTFANPFTAPPFQISR